MTTFFSQNHFCEFARRLYNKWSHFFTQLETSYVIYITTFKNLRPNVDHHRILNSDEMGKRSGQKVMKNWWHHLWAVPFVEYLVTSVFLEYLISLWSIHNVTRDVLNSRPFKRTEFREKFFFSNVLITHIGCSSKNT